MREFKTSDAYRPTGDQPTAIVTLAEGLRDGERYQTLVGATGTGKTATMAWTIEQVGKPALVIAHNKTLAAQLCNEFREFFPTNAVEYFVSYYDYYQPEAYVPQADLYIEKDSSRNDDIDRLRHAATASLLSRRDVVIVASVSCIYGLGSPEEYEKRVVLLTVGEEHDRDLALRKMLEAHRLRQRTEYDLEMMRELGFCSGIENYSRHLDGRPPGSAPNTLLDFFPSDFVVFVDESHQTVPQLGGMYEGDRSRKETLVEHGFRLPSALDNRPLRFDEFLGKVSQLVFVSATPGPFELRRSKRVAEQLIRPTGIVDPEVELRATKNQIDNLLNEIRPREEAGEPA